MKARRVFVQLEVETDRKLEYLKRKNIWELDTFGVFEVKQVQVNVVTEKDKKNK